MKKNPKKGKGSKTLKAKPKATVKLPAKVSKTKAVVESDDDPPVWCPQPRMCVLPGRQAKTKAIENMYHAATGRRLEQSESSSLDNEDESEDDKPVYVSRKGTKTTGLDDDVGQDMLKGKLIETHEKVKKRPVVESPADKTN